MDVCDYKSNYGNKVKINVLMSENVDEGWMGLSVKACPL
jgi:hypothetical protein